MREKFRADIAETIEGLIKIGVKTSLTEKELKELGVEIPQVDLSPNQIKEVRAQHKLSQAVCQSAQCQPVCHPPVGAGPQTQRSTQVLLELLCRTDP